MRASKNQASHKQEDEGRTRATATVGAKPAMETVSYLVVLVLIGVGLSANAGKSTLCRFLSHIKNILTFKSKSESESDSVS